MLNDLWFLKFDFAPYDKDVEERCQKKYYKPWRFHIIFYLFFLLVCWPIALFVFIIEIIRINKAAYYNSCVYYAEYHGKEFVPPQDNRLWLYILAIIIVGSISAVIFFTGPQ